MAVEGAGGWGGKCLVACGFCKLCWALLSVWQAVRMKRSKRQKERFIPGDGLVGLRLSIGEKA